MNEVMQNLSAGLERLAAAASALESQAARMEQAGAAQTGEVGRITAAIEGSEEASRREMELERRLEQAERTIAALEAAGAREVGREEPRVAARKTLPAATVQLLAKQGIDAADQVDVQSLDAALAGLSVEQRIAVKSQMLRTGALTR